MKVVVPAHVGALDYPRPRFTTHATYKWRFAAPTNLWLHTARTCFLLRIIVVAALVQTKVLGQHRLEQSPDGNGIERGAHHPLVMDVNASQRYRDGDPANVGQTWRFVQSFPRSVGLRPVTSPPWALSPTRYRVMLTPGRVRPSHGSSTTPQREFFRMHRLGPIRRNVDSMCYRCRTRVGWHPIGSPCAGTRRFQQRPSCHRDDMGRQAGSVARWKQLASMHLTTPDQAPKPLRDAPILLRLGGDLCILELCRRTLARCSSLQRLAHNPVEFVGFHA